mgnify:CR=1 FL=1
MFLLGWGAHVTPGFVIGCVENIVNVMVFKVSLFLVISELDHFQSTFGCLFGSFLGTLGSLFLIFQGLGSTSEDR